MFDRTQIALAIDLQRRSYQLLRWVANAIDKQFISFDTAHNYATFPEAAAGWIAEHYHNLPQDARPRQEHIEPFSRIFASYLEVSFDLIEDPGKQLYSPGAHCFCPLCSWLTAAPRLQTKKLNPADKKRAKKLAADYLRQLALENQCKINDDDVNQLMNDVNTREAAALGAYGLELLRRLDGRSHGPETLALWRMFAWNETGSPKKNFDLTTNMVFDAEVILLQALA